MRKGEHLEKEKEEIEEIKNFKQMHKFKLNEMIQFIFSIYRQQ